MELILIRLDEVWVRFFGVLVAATASFGHLMSLQGCGNISQVLVAFTCYLAFPEVALAQVLIRTLLMCIRRIWRREQMPIRFLLAACLGLHASSTCSLKKNVSLVFLRPDQTERVPRKINVLWIGRFGLLLAFLAQYIGSAAIWVRLVFHVQDRAYWLWNIDLRTFEIVIGGLVATVNSLLILLVGGDWKLLEAVDASTKAGQTSIGSSEKDMGSCIERRESEMSGLTLRDESVTPSRGKLGAYNASFGLFLDRHFPGLLQSDLELAILIQRAMIHGLAVYTLRHRLPGGCPSILRLLSEASNTFDWTQICPDRANIWDPTTVSQYPRQRDHTSYGRSLHVASVLFNMAVARILVQWVLSMVVKVWEGLARTQMRKVRSFGRWFSSGRSMVSFPLVLLLFSCIPVWIMCQVEQTRWTSHAVTVLQSRAVDDADRMAMNVMMWKDPWQDRLYLI